MKTGSSLTTAEDAGCQECLAQRSSESPELPGYIAVIDKQNDYIKFLEEKVGELEGFARRSGWINKRQHGGQQYRHEIKELKKAI